MAIPVVQLGTGNVGLHALKALITNPQFELTGVWVSSDAKAGRDAAQLAGLEDSTGVLASTDLDAVLATGPQCAVYNAMADNRLPEALEDYRRVLSAGVNIVGSGPVFLQYPWQVIPEELVKPIDVIPHATLVGWLNDREVLIIEDGLLVSFNIADHSRRKSQIKVAKQEYAFVR